MEQTLTILDKTMALSWFSARQDELAQTYMQTIYTPDNGEQVETIGVGIRLAGKGGNLPETREE